MPQQIMNPNYFNPQYRTPMYGQFMPQQEQQFMQQPQQNAVQMYGRIVPVQECIAPNDRQEHKRYLHIKYDSR